ncbi:MAG: hypothetical protein IT581_00355 [Verrucomicrobiales bacterium]|nr:hypothetical protein [Verrucomicrobiales bacterium]
MKHALTRRTTRDGNRAASAAIKRSQSRTGWGWAGSCLLTLATAASADAQDFADARNRIQLGGRVGFNLGVDFRNRGGTVPDTIGPATGGGVDRTYPNGFVRPDAAGNDGGKTWNWGYSEAGQLSADGSALSQRGYTGTPYADSSDRSDDPQYGAELIYSRVLGDIAGAKWGFELGLNWSTFNVEDTSNLTGSITEVTDQYTLEGVIAPAAPYAGSFGGPGPLINDAPTRSSALVPTTVQGSRKLEGNLYGFRLGPMVDLPLGDWLSAQISGGFAAGWLDAEFRYRETASVASGTAWSRAGESSSDEWVLGFYARGQLTVQATDQLGIYAAVEYQGLEDATINAAEQSARVQLDQAVFISLGLNFRF